MYNAFQLALKYTVYYLCAANGKGHGIHSPFVFDLVKNVLNDKKNYPEYALPEQERKKLKEDRGIIDVRDFGAGSSKVKTRERKVSEIAASSLKSKKYSQLLFRLARYFAPKSILELGTSLGVTTAYLSLALPEAKIITCEGDTNIAAKAKNVFNNLGLKNIKVVEGNFDESLQRVIEEHSYADLVYIDGNHRKAPTLDYFRKLRNAADDQQIMIFDDIHWSREMEEAWEVIKTDASVTLTIDLFFIGLVFFRKDFKVKQDFVVRF